LGDPARAKHADRVSLRRGLYAEFGYINERLVTIRQPPGGVGSVSHRTQVTCRDSGFGAEW